LDQALALRLQKALLGTDLDPADKADLGFALAGMLDAAGKNEQAFQAAAEANAASRAAGGPAGHYDRAATEAFVKRLIGTFDHPATGTDSNADAPIFICGLFRSGSTLVEQILGAHSRVHSSGELDLIPALVERIEDYPEGIPNADAATLQSWRDFYR